MLGLPAHREGHERKRVGSTESSVAGDQLGLQGRPASEGRGRRHHPTRAGALRTSCSHTPGRPCRQLGHQAAQAVRMGQ